MPAKLHLSAADYMTVQRIYAGWAWFGIVIFAALGMLSAHTAMVWRHPNARWMSLLALLAMLATQVIFWSYTYPMNVVTRNWTLTPEAFDAVRRQWEVSHAVNAGLTLAALALIAGSVVSWRGRREPS